MKYTVRVTKYGWVTINTDSESEAISIANNLSDDDFDWDYADGARIVDIEEDEESED